MARAGRTAGRRRRGARRARRLAAIAPRRRRRPARAGRRARCGAARSALRRVPNDAARPAVGGAAAAVGRRPARRGGRRRPALSRRTAHPVTPATLLPLLLGLAVVAAWVRLGLRHVRAPGTERGPAWRLVVLLAMQPVVAGLLYRTLVPPRVTASGTLVVATRGAPPTAALTGDPIVALPEAPAVPGAERVPDLATALRRHAPARLRVVGDGLDRARPRRRAGPAARLHPAPSGARPRPPRPAGPGRGRRDVRRRRTGERPRQRRPRRSRRPRRRSRRARRRRRFRRHRDRARRRAGDLHPAHPRRRGDGRDGGGAGVDPRPSPARASSCSPPHPAPRSSICAAGRAMAAWRSTPRSPPAAGSTSATRRCR